MRKDVHEERYEGGTVRTGRESKKKTVSKLDNEVNISRFYRETRRIISIREYAPHITPETRAT